MISRDSLQILPKDLYSCSQYRYCHPFLRKNISLPGNADNDFQISFLNLAVKIWDIIQKIYVLTDKSP